MKISKIGYFFCSGNKVIYSSTENRKILKKQDLNDNQFFEVAYPFDYESFEFIQKKFIILKTRFNSIIFDIDLNRLKTVYFGSGYNNSFFNNFYFVQPSYFVNGKETRLNIIFDEETRQFTTLPITEDIKFYEFHDEYFIPVTYMNAAQGHNYGPELSVYNYQGELVWSKDFREPDTYIDSVPVFHDELSVNTNVKICDDYVMVSTSTNHLFCYDIHTGKQIWCQNQFEGPFPNPQMVALDYEQKMIYVWMYMTFHKIDLLTGQIILSKDMWEWQDRFRHGYVSWTVTKEGLWSATQNHGVVACINKDTLDIDKTYQLESHGTINDSATPHVTDEFIVIPDGLGNLEVIKR
jgi:outer membrane protein assembly factor BamB